MYQRSRFSSSIRPKHREPKSSLSETRRRCSCHFTASASASLAASTSSSATRLAVRRRMFSRHSWANRRRARSRATSGCGIGETLQPGLQLCPRISTVRRSCAVVSRIRTLRLVTTSERARATLSAALPLVGMIVGVKLLWSDVTWGTVLGGTIEGFLIALVALGIAIVYRANRIVNFSAADLGGTPAILALLLYSSWGWNVYVATASGLVSAILLGVIVEFAFLRRFFKAPRLILTVATIGVTQILVALGLALPIWMGNSSTVQFPEFINLNFTVGSGLTSTKFFGNDVLT